MKKKVALGMSGGVDSSLSAHLLVEQGYDVTGVYLECWRAPGCRSETDRQDALKVALELGIPFKVLDFKKEYQQRVVEYFFSEYKAGRTPNPDVMCNKEIKFGLFYDWAMKHNYELVATGHYAQVNQLHQLITSRDEWKDQTYFLYQLTAEQLKHVIFPLGELTKQEVRQLATDRQIHVANKKDSVGICFMGDIDVHQFLKDRLGEKLGEVVDTKGNVIGQHQGVWFYTVGQRHGFTINPTTSIRQSDGTVLEKTNLPPFYVIKKNAAQNQLVVGFGHQTYQDQIKIENLHLIHPDKKFSPEVKVRIRHTGQLLPATFHHHSHRVQLHQPAQGVAAGQSAVLYTPLANGRYQCLGGGVMTETQDKSE